MYETWVFALGLLSSLCLVGIIVLLIVLYVRSRNCTGTVNGSSISATAVSRRGKSTPEEAAGLDYDDDDSILATS